MNIITIVLTPEEVQEFARIGLTQAAAWYLDPNTYRYKEPYPNTMWSLSIEHALAAAAVAKYCPAAHKSKVDLEVKWSMDTIDYPSKGCKVKAGEPDTRIVVAVTGRCPNYKLMGWTLADYAKRPRMYDATFLGCYYVPFDELRPMNELEAYLKERGVS